MIRDHNIKQAQQECEACNLSYLPTMNWTKLLNLIKSDKGDKTYFKPKTDYDLFEMEQKSF